MDELLAKLTALFGSDTDEAKAKVADVAAKAKAAGVETLEDAALLTENDWTGFGVPLVKARKLIIELKPAPTPPANLAGTAAPMDPIAGAASLLPVIPRGKSLIKLLQVGGVPKMEENDVAAAVSVLLAYRMGLFDLEENLMSAIEYRTAKNKEQYPPVYYELQDLFTQKAYRDVFAAAKVSTSRIYTEKNKREFLSKAESFWSLISGFHDRAKAWNDSWLTQSANPLAFQQAMQTMVQQLAGGGMQMGAPPPVNNMPDINPIIASAKKVIDGYNEVFCGPGVLVSRGLAAEADHFQTIFERPELVSATGCMNREELVNLLDLAVSDDITQSEDALKSYAAAIYRLPTESPARVPYILNALVQIGVHIPWDMLRGVPVKPTGNGKRSAGFDAGKPKVY